MKLDRQKYDLAKARACKGQKELMAEGIPKGTLCRAAGGYSLKPETAGKIAKALGVDVTEIIEDQDVGRAYQIAGRKECYYGETNV